MGVTLYIVFRSLFMQELTDSQEFLDSFAAFNSRIACYNPTILSQWLRHDLH